MNKIIYYVATSIDGFISGENEDISGFIPEGNGVQQYLDDLKDFETVIMGRKTYEFGYQYGLKPGSPAYPHMQHYIFSDTLTFEKAESNVHVLTPDIAKISGIREKSKTDIYLCGGGQSAGWLLDNEQIDILKLKVNPLILGSGVSIFGDSRRSFQLELLESERYDKGLFINTYKICY